MPAPRLQGSQWDQAPPTAMPVPPGTVQLKAGSCRAMDTLPQTLFPWGTLDVFDCKVEFCTPGRSGRTTGVPGTR